MKKNILPNLAIIFLSLYLILPSSVHAGWVVTGEGQVVYRSPGQILGQKDELQTSVSAEEGTEDEVATSTKTKNTSAAQASSKSQSKSESAPGQVKVELKTQTNAQEKVKTAIKIKVKNDQLELETAGETELEDEIEIGSNDESTPSGSLEIEDNQHQNKTKIRAQNNAAYVIRNKVAAQSHFPLMVNLETNELIVTTPKGSKVVTVLPDAAVRNMLAANVLDQLGGKGGLRWLEYQDSLKTATDSGDLNDATPSADLEEEGSEDRDNATGSSDLVDPPVSSMSALPEPTPALEVVDEADNVIVLTTTENGTLVYEIQGVKNKKLLGFKPVELQRTVVVSAETGEIIQIVQDLRTRLLGLLSFE